MFACYAVLGSLALLCWVHQRVHVTMTVQRTTDAYFGTFNNKASNSNSKLRVIMKFDSHLLLSIALDEYSTPFLTMLCFSLTCCCTVLSKCCVVKSSLAASKT